MTAPIPAERLLGLVADIVAGEVQTARGPGGVPFKMPHPDALAGRVLNEADLGLDSLEQMGVHLALTAFFGEAVATACEADQPATLGAWATAAARAWGEPESCVGLRTSGSTGAARSCSHRVGDLLDEARAFASLLEPSSRVVALVPARHVYGLIWTVLLPSVLDVPVLRHADAARVTLQTRDLVIAVPDQWQGLLRRGPDALPPGITGISSGAPLAPDIARALRDGRLERLVEVYGSSETAGIGWRDAAGFYRLLPRWQPFRPGETPERLVARDGSHWPLPDRVTAVAGGFVVEGRRDGVVQVGGTNVDPGHVVAILRQVAGVDDLAVRLGANGRLKAFVVPEPGVPEQVLLGRLVEHVRECLPAVARPTAYRFGPALPRNAMGKLADWP